MWLRLSWQDAIGQLDSLFEAIGFRVIRSFDLQLARQGLQDPQSCPCPHHGTAQCTCQYLVYLLYTQDPNLLTVVVHGYDNQTEVSIEADDDERAQLLRRKITQQFLLPKIPLRALGNSWDDDTSIRSNDGVEIG